MQIRLPPEARAYDEATILRAERDEMLAELREIARCGQNGTRWPLGRDSCHMMLDAMRGCALRAIAKAEGRSPSAPYPAPASTG